MVAIVGVDGCKAGWVAAFCDSLFETEPVIAVFSSFREILDSPFAPAIVAIDMPIGLPDRVGSRGRGPEEAVRAVLGARRNSVFSIPARAAVYAVDRRIEGMAEIGRSHALACAVARKTSEAGTAFSRQAFMILPKIREVDRLLRDDMALLDRVREIHPEVAFWSMNRRSPLRFGKRHASGEAERAALLQSQGLSRAAIEAAPPRGAKRDDVTDALAALVVAAHIAEGRGKPFPDPPGRDSHGLPIAIWSF